jgi:putative RNA 2'-phosphotransferase
MSEDLTETSKFLSYVLRHNPAAIGAELDEHGWIDIEILLVAAGTHGRVISPSVLHEIMTAPGKRRFETQGTRIRAAHGHSVSVDLQLESSEPPSRLYHGTVARFLPGIRVEGLKPGKRAHVHLSADSATAGQAASRRGSPVILTIDAAGAYKHGHLFYCAANGTWLTGYVSPAWIIE